MKKTILNRQGDIGIIKITSIPTKAKKITPKNGEYIIAYGEATGHRHVITAEPKTKYEVFQDDNGMFYINIQSGQALVKHLNEDNETTDTMHKEHIIEKGIYILDGQYEYDEEEELRVLD